MDHFRPEHLFPELVDEYLNLYYACYPCNHKKWQHWPDPDLQARGIGYVDLCADDYGTHYRLNPDGSLETLTESAAWTAHAIRLNSPHLITVRRLIAELSTIGDVGESVFGHRISFFPYCDTPESLISYPVKRNPG